MYVRMGPNEDLFCGAKSENNLIVMIPESNTGAGAC